MLEILKTIGELIMSGVNGIVDLLSLVGTIAIGGAGIAFIFMVVANIVFWPVFLIKSSKKQKNSVA